MRQPAASLNQKTTITAVALAVAVAVAAVETLVVASSFVGGILGCRPLFFN